MARETKPIPTVDWKEVSCDYEDCDKSGCLLYEVTKDTSVCKEHYGVLKRKGKI